MPRVKLARLIFEIGSQELGRRGGYKNDSTIANSLYQINNALLNSL